MIEAEVIMRTRFAAKAAALWTRFADLQFGLPGVNVVVYSKRVFTSTDVYPAQEDM